MTGHRNRSLSSDTAFANVLKGELRNKSHRHRFHSRNRVLKSALHWSGLAGMTDVHCITNGRTFHLQKKKVHNKSSDLSAKHPVALASRVREFAENEISPRRDGRCGAAPLALSKFKRCLLRDAPLWENGGWMVSTEGPRRKVGQGKSVRA